MRFDEVLEKLTELHQVGAHGRQFVADDYRLFFIDGDLQTIERVFYRGCGFDRRRRSSLHIDTRLDEQILDDDLHALGVVDQVHVFCGFFVQRVAEIAPEAVRCRSPSRATAPANHGRRHWRTVPAPRLIAAALHCAWQAPAGSAFAP